MANLFRPTLLAAASAAVLALASTAASAEQCKGFAAVGSGLTESIASLMAKQGAINVAENRGWTVKGEAKLLKCESTGIFGTECTATSYACKK